VLPYAIAANAIIFKKASCEICAEQFKREFEAYVLSKTLYPFRFKIGAPTRNRKVRPKTLGVHFALPSPPEVPATIVHTKQFVPAELPLDLIVLRLRPPKILRGEIASEHDKVDAWSNIDKARLVETAGPLRPIRIFVGEIHPLRFARFLAKIAYAYAIAEIGWGQFVPLILPLIFGRTNVVSDLVGGEYDLSPPTKGLHELHHYVTSFGGNNFVCVKLRLFSCYGAPTYHIVVGLRR